MSTFTIAIDRYDGGSQRHGVLRARVRQGGHYGKDLLYNRSLTSIESAKRTAEFALRSELSRAGITVDAVQFEVREP